MQDITFKVSQDQAYPYGDIMCSVTSAPTVAAAAERLDSWRNAGWTMDYMVEHGRACAACRDAQGLLGLMTVFGLS